MGFAAVASGLIAGTQLFAGAAAGRADRDRLLAEAAAGEENARRTQANAAAEALTGYRAERAAIGEDLAALAGSGGLLGGSMMDIIEQSVVERELRRMNLQFAAAEEAATLRATAETQRRAAKGAVTRGLFGGLVQALGTAGGYAQNRKLNKMREKNLRDQIKAREA